METLCVAVYILVRPKLSGVVWDLDSFAAQRDEALGVVSEYHSDRKSSEPLDPTEVNEWLCKIREGGWPDLDWYANVGQGAGLGLEDNEIETAGASDDDDMDEDADLVQRNRRFDGQAAEDTFLQPGLGTMVSHW